MTEPSTQRAGMAVSRIIRAPRRAVYAACLDPDALITWRVPENMVGRVHAFEAREGGGYRMSLTYREPAQGPGGKTSADTDTFQGRFIELVPDEKIVEAVRFESDDPGFGGEMTITTRLTDTSDGTEIIMWFQDLPPGVRPEDNELGTRQALHKLAKLLE